MESIVAYYSEKLTLAKTEFLVSRYQNCLLFGNLDRSIEVLQNVIENAQKYGDGTCIELLFSEEDEGVLIAVRNRSSYFWESLRLHSFFCAIRVSIQCL